MAPADAVWPMGLRVVVAAPFRQRGRDRLAESEFVVALSLDRNWYSPDQASRILDLAVARGLLAREDGDFVAQFDPDSVEIPSGFVPDESLLVERSPFERAVETLVSEGMDKREAVAGINRVQADLAITVDAAAVVFVRRAGIDATDLATEVRRSLGAGS